MVLPLLPTSYNYVPPPIITPVNLTIHAPAGGVIAAHLPSLRNPTHAPNATEISSY